MANWAALFSPTTASATSTQPATTPIQQNRFIVFYKFDTWAVVVAQLTARMLRIPNDPGSNPVIDKFC